MCRKLKAAFKARKAKAKKAGKKFKEKLHLLPRSMEYFQREFRCVHGDYQKSKRGAGDTAKPRRYQATTLYTGCPARITALAKRNPRTNEWSVVPHHEVRTFVLLYFTTLSFFADAVFMAHCRTVCTTTSATRRCMSAIR